MNEMTEICRAVEKAVAERMKSFAQREKYHRRKIMDQRRLIKDLRKQVKEFSSYVNSGKQQLDMIKLAQVAGKFDRETHLLEIVKMAPEAKEALCNSLQHLLPWAYPCWAGVELTSATAEEYAAACIALESLINETR